MRNSIWASGRNEDVSELYGAWLQGLEYPVVQLLLVLVRDALSELEKGLSVLMLIHTLYKAEGVTHLFSHHLRKVPRLLSFLATINAPNETAIRSLSQLLRPRTGRPVDSAALEDFLCDLNNEDHDEITALGDQDYTQAEAMWSRAAQYQQAEYGVQMD